MLAIGKYHSADRVSSLGSRCASHLVVAWLFVLTCPPVDAWQDAAPSQPAKSATEPSPADQPAPADQAAAMPDLRPCSFQQVTPGETKLDQVFERLGKPSEETEKNEERVLTYVLEPFAKVEVFLSRNVVSSIVLHLKEAASPRQVAKELGIENFTPAPVTSETGQLLGRAYPERGVLLNFALDSASHKVSQLVLEPLGAEPFILRVKHDTLHQYQQNLADLEIALQLDPSHIDALSWKATMLAATRQPDQALSTIEQALSLAPGDPPLVLQHVDLLLKLERHDEALAAVKNVVADPATSAVLRARAECLLGDLAAVGPRRDFAKAIEHHLAAIKMASPLASDRVLAVRRDAKKILLDAFLAAAHDIAAGNWQQQEETVAKWLAGARELADAAVAQDGADESLKLRVQLAMLAAHADMHSDIDPAQLIASVEREVKRLKEASGDPLLEQSLALSQAWALLDAASIEHGRDAKLKAFDYAAQAAQLIEPLTIDQQSAATERYLAGRLYFFVGSSHAVIHRNHVEAVRWYEKARGFLADPLPLSAAGDLGRHGERLVSMGASYWETGEQQEALELTRRGLEMMKQAAKQGLIGEDKLALPYGNLAAMYQSVGKSEEAKTFAEIASRLSTATPTTNPRR